MYSTHSRQIQTPTSAVQARLARYEAMRARISAPVPDAARPVLQPHPPALATQDIPAPQPSPRPRAGHLPVLARLWPARRLIACCMGIGLMSALALTSTLPPRFSAHAEIALTLAQTQSINESGTAPGADTPAAVIEGLVRVLTSTTVLGQAAAALDLASDPEFSGSQAAILHALGERVDAGRDGQSSVVRLTVWSGDAQKSVAIANAVTTAFAEEVQRINAESAQASSLSVAERLGDLRASADAAEAAVQSFRRAHGLHETGRLAPSQMNEQLIAAQAALIVAETRHAELSAARAEGGVGAMSFNSETLSALRARYLELRRELDAAEATLGPLHPTIATLRPQAQTLERDLTNELDRMLRLATSELEQARERVERLAGGPSSATVPDAALQLELRGLERDAEAQAALYGAYLLRAADIAEQGQSGATTVRVISPPMPARSPSWPPQLPWLLALGAATGLAGGVGLRVALDRLAGKRSGAGKRPARHGITVPA